MTAATLTAGAPGAVTGAGLLESATDLLNGIRSQDWVETGLGGAGVALDTYSLAVDPLGTIAEWGLAWLMEHVAPLTRMLDWIAGDPGQLAQHVAVWEDVARILDAQGEELDVAVGQLAQRWTGQAGTAAARDGQRHGDVVTTAGRVAAGIAAAVAGGALLVALTRGLVRDLIAKCVATLAVRVPQWIAATGASGGAATPAVIAQIQALVARFGKLVADLIRALTASLQRLGGYVARLGELLGSLRAMIRGAGRVPSSGGGGAFRTTSIDPKYRGENRPGGYFGDKQVRYLNAAEREQYRLTVRDGRLWDSTGQPFDTSTDGYANALFVMDREGNLFASTYRETGVFHHSSFLGGQPAAAAGTITVRDGVPVVVTDHSGHYLPPRAHTDAFVLHLGSQGVDVSGLRVHYKAPK